MCMCINTHTHTYEWQRRLTIRNWLMQVREVEKSQGVPSASWRSRRDNRAVPESSPAAWGSRTDDVSSSLSPEVGENQCLAQRQAGREQILPSSVFCSIPEFQRIGGQPTLGRAICLTRLTQSAVPMLISSGSTLTGTPRIITDQISGYPVAKSESTHKMNHNSSLISKSETFHFIYLGSKSHQVKWIWGSIPILNLSLLLASVLKHCKFTTYYHF